MRRTSECSTLQGYLAHKECPPPPWDHRHSPDVGSKDGVVSYERGTPVNIKGIGADQRLGVGRAIVLDPPGAEGIGLRLGFGEAEKPAKTACGFVLPSFRGFVLRRVACFGFLVSCSVFRDPGVVFRVSGSMVPEFGFRVPHFASRDSGCGARCGSTVHSEHVVTVPRSPE